MRPRTAVEALLGTYLAMVLVPGVALTMRALGRGLPSRRLLMAGGLLTAVAMTLAARTTVDLVERVTAPAVVVATVVPPLAYLPALVATAAPGSPVAAVAAAGLLAVLPGLGVPTGAVILRNRRLRKRATERTVVTVGDDGGRDRRDWLFVSAAVLLGVVSLVTGLATVLVGGFDLSITTLFGSVSTFLLLLDDDDTELAVTDRGLRIDRSLVPWDELEGYRVTEDRIVLVRSQWYLPARRFDRDEVGDEPALLDGLGSFLPRLDAADDGRRR